MRMFFNPKPDTFSDTLYIEVETTHCVVFFLNTPYVFFNKFERKPLRITGKRFSLQQIQIIKYF